MIKKNIEHLTEQIAKIASACERDPSSVTLLAVSKTKPVSAIQEAIAAGLTEFGENYVQEGVEKVTFFKQTQPEQVLCWHFIGPIQSNKTRPVAESFDWVHTIDRAKIAERLNAQRPDELRSLQVLIQVNISNQASKSGVAPNEVFALAKLITSLPKLCLRGLMCIPEPTDDPIKQKEIFAKMAHIGQQLSEIYPSVDTLSMGMSDDMTAAIETGSTMIRIGTAIFGRRGD